MRNNKFKASAQQIQNITNLVLHGTNQIEPPQIKKNVKKASGISLRSSGGFILVLVVQSDGTAAVLVPYSYSTRTQYRVQYSSRLDFASSIEREREERKRERERDHTHTKFYRSEEPMQSARDTRGNLDKHQPTGQRSPVKLQQAH